MAAPHRTFVSICPTSTCHGREGGAKRGISGRSGGQERNRAQPQMRSMASCFGLTFGLMPGGALPVIIFVLLPFTQPETLNHIIPHFGFTEDSSAGKNPRKQKHGKKNALIPEGLFEPLLHPGLDKH